MNLENKLFTLEGGKKYFILESIYYDSKLYAFFSNIDNELDSMIVELQIENGIKIKKSKYTICIYSR